MKIAVLGATGRTGRLVIEQALARGAQVVAYVRNSQDIQAQPGLRVVTGQLNQVGDLPALKMAVSGTDAVLVCLGTRKKKPVDLMQKSLPLIIQAMQELSVLRLVLLSAYGVGETALTAGLLARVLYKTWAASFYRDKALSEALLPASGLQWTSIYPVGLSDGPMVDGVELRPMALVQKVRGLPRVSRANVARVMLETAGNTHTIGQQLLVSSAGSVR